MLVGDGWYGVSVLVNDVAVLVDRLPLLRRDAEQVFGHAERVALREREELGAYLHAQHVAHGLVHDPEELGREERVPERAVDVGVVHENLHERAAHGVGLRVARPLLPLAVAPRERQHRVGEVRDVAGRAAHPSTPERTTPQPMRPSSLSQSAANWLAEWTRTFADGCPFRPA